jgi:hypothetical protein
VVSTGGTSAGGSGFEYGENTVAARLSIDIPNEGVQSLREITQEISRFRTEMEAASRSQGDFIGFFQTLPSIASQAASAFKTYADELERGLALQQRMQGAVGQWDVQPGSTPDNFRGMTSGMGRSGPNDINQTVADMDRMREMGTVGQRQYLNVQQQHGGIRPGEMPMSNNDNDIAAATDRISARERINQERIGGDITGGMGGSRSGGGVAREIMNEFSAGGGGSQGGLMTQMMRRGLGALSARSGDAAVRDTAAAGSPGHSSGAVVTPESGSSGAVGADGQGAGAAGSALSGMGILGKIFGVPGAGLAGLAGLGLTGYGAAQMLGPKIQNLKDAGLVEGGGAKEGLEQEIQARIMGMNPFITNDQSRSIIQSALRDGYKGKEFETVTKFMQENLKDFAISVQDSRDMLKKQVLEGGMAPEAIAAGLEQQKYLSRTGALSFEDRKAAQNRLQGLMADNAVSPDVIGSSSAGSLEMYSDNHLLKGKFSDMAMAGQSGDMGLMAAQANMMGIPLSSDMDQWADQIAAQGPAGQDRLVKRALQMSKGNSYQFRQFMKQFGGMDLTIAQAKELMNKTRGGGELSAAQGRLQESNGAFDVQRRSSAEVVTGTVGGFFSNVLGDTISDIAGGRFSEIPGNLREATFDGGRDHIPVLDQVVKANGGDPNGIMVQSSSGEWQKLQEKNRAQLDALAKGGKWRRADDTSGEGYTLRGASGAMASGYLGKQEVQVGGQVSIHVSTDPGVKVSSAPQTITLTQNQMKANAGWGNATTNNRPPGDR